MKNLLKKLHMMPNQSEDVDGSTSVRGSRSGDVPIEKVSPSRSSPSHSEQKTFSNLSGWLNSVTNRHSLSPPSSSNVRRGDKWELPSDSLSNSGLDAVLDTMRQESESSNSRDPEVEEEYQIQLALEISAREDPEAVHIEAVKQMLKRIRKNLTLCEELMTTTMRVTLKMIRMRSYLRSLVPLIRTLKISWLYWITRLEGRVGL